MSGTKNRARARFFVNCCSLLFGSSSQFGAVNQFHVGHGCRITSAEAALEDTDIAAGTVCVALAQVVEQLAHSFFAAGAVKRQTAVGYGIFFRQGDQRLCDAAQFLGLGQSGFDQFVFEQRHCHVLEHGLAASWSDSGDDHFYDDASLNSSVSDDQALTLSSFFKLAGGQLSRRIPSDRPREARTSLISVRDFLPRFGVFSSSTSVRWIRSPI